MSSIQTVQNGTCIYVKRQISRITGVIMKQTNEIN